MSHKDTYHLTPRTLVGQRFAPSTFSGIKIALMGFCPPPLALTSYNPCSVSDQHFIHVSPDSVQLLKHGTQRYLSLSHVYGGPVSSATVDELAYYGIEYILAYGLAGGLGTKSLGMGAFYLVESALAADGTTPHYSPDAIIRPDPHLVRKVTQLWNSTGSKSLYSVHAATGDAIYREDDAMLTEFRDQGCDIVNLDSAHLYAVSSNNNEGRTIRTVQCGVISDVIHADAGKYSESTLSVMLSNSSSNISDPLENVGEIISFYIETLSPSLKLY